MREAAAATSAAAATTAGKRSPLWAHGLFLLGGAHETAFPVLQWLIPAGCGGVAGGHQWSVSPWMRRVGLAVWLVAAVIVVLVAAFWGIQRL
ncbi:hypothetical protein CA983_21255 [Streptomyces swartbergensis]|uniref:Uncharacterized protein n=1 Tax=Streptomyces swartbergensis TaxID=487165 RepID=A0A243S164_9ACTN|nr:hypothetical protein CA983_21255 [Streptomyces swartbergensis]